MAHFLVFLGSARNSSPPSPPRLGMRVARCCLRLLQGQGHTGELVDPLDIDLGQVFKPQFAYAAATCPESLRALDGHIRAADGYVMVSPEYNHCMSPALSHLLNHFGSSAFAFKPSAIVTYSAGQWGGARAAVNMRTFLSELGCLPVSAMVHVPHAQQALDEHGAFCAEADEWEGYFRRTLNQMIWWAEAAAAQRTRHDPIKLSPAFVRSPSQRNAP